MFTIRGNDPFQGIHWQLWLKDRFDSESPRQVEKEGQSLVKGLKTLWMHHVKEGVFPDGRETFTRFNLWSKDLDRSFAVYGPRTGMKKILDWLFVYQNKKSNTKFLLNQRLLSKIVLAHYQLITQGLDSGEILKGAESAADSQAFIKILDSIIKGPSPL